VTPACNTSSCWLVMTCGCLQRARNRARFVAAVSGLKLPGCPRGARTGGRVVHVGQQAWSRPRLAFPTFP
jgi:hypothetical protein